ncbi:HesA/MoeB/ThiF family protein [Phenylobacterium soli]|nr:ThiF family adenylyltransferase [Phenylobacterium soli]
MSFFTRTGFGGRALSVLAERAPAGAYLRRTDVAAELAPAYLVELTARARRMGAGLVMAHTHPFDHGMPEFSDVDNAGEEPLRAFLEARLPTQPHAAMVISQGGVRARVLGGAAAVKVVRVGAEVRTLFDPDLSASSFSHDVYDRQVRAFGRAGQTAIASTEVALVGLGGTGSVVAQELAHLGVRRFLLIDPDKLETSNRNRVFGAQPELIGRHKVEIAAENILKVNPQAQIETRVEDVLTRAAADRLAESDFIFLCTDSHASRAMVSQLAYQHLVPAIDMGVSIGVGDAGEVREITGRAQMLAPGLGCLLCAGAISSEVVRIEMMTEVQRAQDPYFRGQGEPQPAVVSLNATMSSLAVSMFMGAVTSAPFRARYQWYDGVTGRLRTPTVGRNPGCLVCSSSGVIGHGPSATNPLRGAR